jgi:ATP-binding cassette subfamily F protein 3
MTQLAMSGVGVEFGATTLLRDVTFTVGAGDKWGVVGRNGAGKTTLFRLITGVMQPTRGQVTRVGGLRISLLEQHRDFGGASTVWEAAAGPFAHLLALELSLAEQAAALGTGSDEDALARYGHDLERFEHEGGYTMESRVDAVLQGLGFDPVEARTRPLVALSGGERGRLGLARQLVAPADVLLLDEPTNHLDLETTAWLEQYLMETDETVILVSHDRAFLAAVVDHVLHVEGGTATPYTGTYEAFVMQRAERRLSAQRSLDKQRKVIANEQDYIRRNIAGQNSKQAKGRRKRLDRLPRLSAPPGEEDTMALRLDVAERGGDQVVSAEDVRITIEDRVLVDHVTTRVMRGDRVGIIGPNGAGKSTFLRALVGEHPVDGGELRVGGSIRVAHYRQDLAQVPLDRTLYQVINDLRPLWTRGQIQSHLARFGFSGDEAQRRAESLSGGERARVALAIMMLENANLLILDEPTNHLDVESIEALEDAVEQYPGTVLMVSHDRAMLRALATRVWRLDDQRIAVFDGSFAEWEEDAEDRARATAAAASDDTARRRAETARESERAAKSTRTAAPAKSDRSGRTGGAPNTGSTGKGGGSANGTGSRDASALRSARRAADAAEGRVADAEREVARLESELQDPALYEGKEGAARAARLNAELSRARATLKTALDSWAAASEDVERLAPSA